MNTNLPEKMWLEQYGDDEHTYRGTLDHTEGARYIRADLHEAECERLRGEVETTKRHWCEDWADDDTAIKAILPEALAETGEELPKRKWFQWDDPERDWPEDKPMENGGYQCRCITCSHLFTGHKRRVTCKACAQPADETAGEWETFNPSPENRVQDGDEYRNLRLKLPYQDLTQWKPVDSTKIGWDSWVFAGDEFRRRVQKGAALP